MAIGHGGDIAKLQIMGFDFLTCNICFKEKVSCACLLAWSQAHFVPRTIIVSMPKKKYKKLFISRIGFSWSLVFHGKYHFMCIHESSLLLLLNGCVFPVMQTSALL